MLKLVVLCGLLALVRSQSTPVNQCVVHQAPLPINTYISGCESTPCRLPQLSNVEFYMIFKAPHTMRSMRTVATAYLFGIPVPYDLEENGVTCNFLTNTYCPVLKDEVVQYTLVMFMEPTFVVGISVTIEFRIVDEATGLPFLCIRVPLTIVSPLPSRGIAGNNSTISP